VKGGAESGVEIAVDAESAFEVGVQVKFGVERELEVEVGLASGVERELEVEVGLASEVNALGGEWICLFAFFDSTVRMRLIGGPSASGEGCTRGSRPVGIDERGLEFDRLGEGCIRVVRFLFGAAGTRLIGGPSAPLAVGDGRTIGIGRRMGFEGND